MTRVVRRPTLAKNRRLRSPIPSKSSVLERARSSGVGLGMGQTRLMRGDTVIMAKTPPTTDRDVAGDVADAVGSAIGAIVNEIEQLDERRAELIQQLQRASESVNAQLGKWLPAGVTDMPRKAREGYERARKSLDRPCAICGFRTKPYHDGRLKLHRDQGDRKMPLTDAQLEALQLRKV